MRLIIYLQETVMINFKLFKLFLSLTIVTPITIF